MASPPWEITEVGGKTLEDCKHHLALHISYGYEPIGDFYIANNNSVWIKIKKTQDQIELEQTYLDIPEQNYIHN